MGTPRIQHGEKQDMLYDIKKGISSLDFMNKYERCEHTYYSLKRSISFYSEIVSKDMIAPKADIKNIEKETIKGTNKSRKEAFTKLLKVNNFPEKYKMEVQKEYYALCYYTRKLIDLIRTSESKDALQETEFRYSLILDMGCRDFLKLYNLKLLPSLLYVLEHSKFFHHKVMNKSRLLLDEKWLHLPANMELTDLKFTYDRFSSEDYHMENLFKELFMLYEERSETHHKFKQIDTIYKDISKLIYKYI